MAGTSSLCHKSTRRAKASSFTASVPPPPGVPPDAEVPAITISGVSRKGSSGPPPRSTPTCAAVSSTVLPVTELAQGQRQCHEWVMQVVEWILCSSTTWRSTYVGPAKAPANMSVTRIRPELSSADSPAGDELGLVAGVTHTHTSSQRPRDEHGCTMRVSVDCPALCASCVPMCGVMMRLETAAGPRMLTGRNGLARGTLTVVRPAPSARVRIFVGTPPKVPASRCLADNKSPVIPLAV